ncbi:MAG: hypothetical protein EPO28_14100 [Saprospiraceae bacterium]|nr:MAG: hypothetical protein EPO28_14100 [Saprospiraceae bacterium]
MTVQLNFDKANQRRLLPLLEWLREIGLVKSFQVATDATASPAVDGEVFLYQMPENAEKDLAQGNLMTSEEVLKGLKNWVSKDKTGTLARQPANALGKILQQAKLIVTSMPPGAENQEKPFAIAFAALLYEKDILTAGQAAELADIPKSDFIRQMGKFHVSVFGETVEEISAL